MESDPVDRTVRFVVNQFALTAYADDHDKRIQCRKVLRNRFVNVEKGRGEILATRQGCLRILDFRIGCPVIRMYRVVYRLLRLFDMELTGLAVQAQTTVVINSVGNV